MATARLDSRFARLSWGTHSVLHLGTKDRKLALQSPWESWAKFRRMPISTWMSAVPERICYILTASLLSKGPNNTLEYEYIL